MFWTWAAAGGCRLSKTILEHDIPIARYVGLDVYAEMIEFLQANVTDPRFSFHRLDAHNAMYNTTGKPLAEVEAPALDKGSFDIICLYSVFTHLAPHDYVAMLKFLRPFVKPDGKLIFSLFVNEETDAGLGFIDAIRRALAKKMASPDIQPENFDKQSDKFASYLAGNGPPDFTDWDPNRPLQWAVFSRNHAIELVEGTGWKIESLNDPEESIQHYMICTPV